MNRYSFYARVLPMTLALAPVVITGAILSINFGQYTPILISSGITAAFSFLLSQLGRDAGKKKEPSLWQSWGGTPSVTLLSWADETIDVNTKERYHAKLQAIFPLTTIPERDFEASNPTVCNECYAAWTKFLLSKTRDTKEFGLLFSENINYGYRRNLWGLKPFAIFLVLACMLFSYGFLAFKAGSYSPRKLNEIFYVAEFVLTTILLFWLIAVNRNWIKQTAFAYAHRLLESTEKL